MQKEMDEKILEREKEARRETIKIIMTPILIILVVAIMFLFKVM